jgi:murein DD-endopeptidase MepM/ murein hydrolase activator NlpD
MPKSLYRYNSDTCRYERVKTAPRDVVMYAIGVIVTAIAMLGGLLSLHDFVFDSPNEIALRKENAMLARNSVVLANQLAEIDESLISLHKEDKRLHQKFFGVELTEPLSTNQSASKQQLLLADPDAFQKAANAIDNSSKNLLKQSASSNLLFSNTIDFGKDDFQKMESMPTSLPVEPWENDKLISGFGMRINPFHKGLYEHPGVDIALPRGTFVRTTAPGTVVLVKTNDLQAGYGNYIEIDHGHGFVTRYAHLENINVRYGQKVKKGFVIATSGSSGGSVAPHLHYEIIVNGKNVDPVMYMIEGLTSGMHAELKVRNQKQNQSLD